MANYPNDLPHIFAQISYNKFVNDVLMYADNHPGVSCAFLTDWFPGYPRITSTPCDKLYLGVKYAYDNTKMDYLDTIDFSSAMRDILLEEHWTETNPGHFFVINL